MSAQEERPGPNSKKSSKGGRPSRSDAERLQTAILDTAEKMFLTKGFGDTSIEAIAAASGTAKKTIYARFGSKEGLFIAVDERILARPDNRNFIASGSFEERLVATSLAMLSRMLEPKLVRIYGIITGEAQRFPELARRGEYAAAFPARRALRELLIEGRKAGEIEFDDLQRTTELLETMINMAPLNWTILGVKQMDEAAQEEWVRAAVDLFMHGCKPRC